MSQHVKKERKIPSLMTLDPDSKLLVLVEKLFKEELESST